MTIIQKILHHPRAYLITASLLMTLLFGIYSTGILILGLDHPYWGDEEHFVATVRYFMATPWTEAIQDYRELTAPLSYLLYAAWGHLFGGSLLALRSMSLIFSLATALIFHRLVYEETQNPLLSLLASLWLFVNPYVVGASLFVFTDIVALFFLILAFWAALRSHPGAFLFAAAAALLTRQYLIFLIAAVGVYYAARWLIHQQKQSFSMFASSILSCVPLMALMAVWGGLSPVTARQLWLHGTSGLALYPFYLTDYLSTAPVYVLPFLILANRSVLRNARLWLVALGLSVYYFIFPVAPSWVLKIETELLTIGYFHRLVKMIAPWQFLEHAILYILFVIGLTLLVYLIHDGWNRLVCRQLDTRLLMDMAILDFFLVMAFSFHVWEKYLLPVLPLIILRLLLTSELQPSWLNTRKPV